MPTIMYSKALYEMFDGTITFPTETGLKIMLVTSTYVPDQDDEVVDAGGATDPIDAEINVGGTGYTGGFAGAGRKVIPPDLFQNNVQNRVQLGFNSGLTWTGLGGSATIAGAVLIRETGTDDTTTRLISYFDINDFTTNGGDFTLNFLSASGAAGGHFRFPV